MRVPRRPWFGVVPALGAASAAARIPELNSPTSPLLLGLAVLAAVIAVVLVVVWAAVWSKKKTRRDAALAVLDRVFGRQISDPAKSAPRSRHKSST